MNFSIRDGLKTIDFLPFLFFTLAAIIWRTEYYSYSLYLFIPLMIGLSFLKYWQRITRSKYFVPYLLLIAWMILSCVMNPDTSRSLSKMVAYVATFLISCGLIGLSTKGNNTKVLYWSYILLFISLMYAVYAANGQFLSDFDYANERERESATLLDANQYAYFSMLALMALRLTLEDKPIRLIFLRVGLYVVMAGVSIYVALITASRQVLLLQIPLICYFFYFDFLRNRRRKISIAPFLLMAAVLILFIPSILDVYNNSYLSVRSETSVAEDSRWNLFKLGIETGLEHPVVGIGFGARAKFTHCTYTHLFSRCGFISLLLFCIIVFKPFFEQTRRYRLTHDAMFLLYRFCILIFIAANFFYSYINQPFMMTFLFLIIGDSNKRYNDLQYNVQ